MAAAAPGRFVAGIGASSNVIVESWNGVAFDRPLSRTRDLVRFLRVALAGERVDATFDTFAVHGFRLARPPAQPVPLLVAALRPAMARMGWAEADGLILNWLAPEDVGRVLGELPDGGAAAGAGKEVAIRLFVVPTGDVEEARAVGRRALTAYLTVPVYAAFHRWLGRGEALAGMWDAWERGDRRGALAAIPDEVVDDLVVHGSYDECRAHVQRYVDNGVTTPALAILPLADVDVREAVRQLAPR
jgi:probable F420-dependent oxidoreductase